MLLKKLPVVLAAMPAMFAAMLVASSTCAAGQTEKVLHSFNNNGSDGYQPESGVSFDAVGNLFGTTQLGGTGACTGLSLQSGCGTVYVLVPRSNGDWIEKVLHSFILNGKDGLEPAGNGLIFDASGNLYGTTVAGGTSADCPNDYLGTSGCGTVFAMVRKSKTGFSPPVILHNFDGDNEGVDGTLPLGAPTFDSAGNLYGTTSAGGTSGYGMAFKLTRKAGAPWDETDMYDFYDNGIDPAGSLIFDADGDLYGLAAGGGQYHEGAVFELTPNTQGGWSEELLHSFGHGTDGFQPLGSLIFDKAGNLYGVTTGAVGEFGTVFELTPGTGGTWTETVLHVFTKNGTDGLGPNGPLVMDASGNLYGTTVAGGSGTCSGGCGAVYELSPQAGGTWSETILYSFLNNGADGIGPTSGLTFDSSGNLYGVTSGGGVNGNGTVYEVTP
jgi:uncharacterized repeat protein (TIGR03803 family)